MNRPKTLFELAGLSLPPASWQTAVLLLIDHQREYDVGGGLELPEVVGAKKRIGDLLAQARAKGTPVFHVAHHGKPGGLFDPTGSNSAFMTELQPKDGETTVVKSLPNSFAKTELADLLAKAGRKELIVAGFMTHMCVSATVRAAIDNGYFSTVVSEACATRDLPDPCGGAVPADVVHQVALCELADRFAIVVKDASGIRD